jgi:hypothetical protein
LPHLKALHASGHDQETLPGTRQSDWEALIKKPCTIETLGAVAHTKLKN